MLLQADLGKQYWVEAVETANYTLNRLPSSAIDGQIPFTLWTGHKPSLAHVRVFGSPAYAYVPDSQRAKFDARSEKYILAGFANSLKCYKLLHPITHKPRYARSVIIHESAIMESLPGQQAERDDSDLVDTYSEAGGDVPDEFDELDAQLPPRSSQGSIEELVHSQAYESDVSTDSQTSSQLPSTSASTP